MCIRDRVQVARCQCGLLAQGLHHQRCQPVDEAWMAAQLHLEAQALAFVQSHRAGVGHRLAQPLARQVLLVTAMAGLVHRAHQAAQEVVLAKARGHAHVLGHAAAEGVGADIQPAGIEIEAQQAHDPVSYTHLDVYKRQPIAAMSLAAALMPNPPHK